MRQRRLVAIELKVGDFKPEFKGQMELYLYHARPETWNLDRAKAPGLNDRKRVHIDNIEPFAIVQPRELSRRPKSKFMTECGIRWLDKHERQPGEESPIGLILCTGKNHECIELLEPDKAGIHVAEYLTALPSKEVLRQQLQQASKRARHRLEEAAHEQLS